MKNLSIILFTTFLFTVSSFHCFSQNTPSSFLKGNFVDDYGIKYTINDTLWVQHPNIKYHIIKWNVAEQYVIAKNGSGHRSDENKYTRIDFMKFEGMQPWIWGFCLTAYQAKNEQEAAQTAAADRKNPKKGCNGFPFSRMKLVD
ncbi:hypothetical protein [Pedobacter sp.]